jgi:myo-inositol-1(or 4)-monophosphatase
VDADDDAGQTASPDALLEVASAAAELAGSLLRERFEAGAERTVSTKSTPTDLVSEADFAAQRAIRRLLDDRRPDDGFLGEEGGDAAGSTGLRWIVDPLDGTVNFLFGIPQWSVSVAVRDDAGTIAGAVLDANRDELFSATREGTAQLDGPRGALELADRAGPDERLTGEDAAPGGTDLASAMVATGLAYDSEVRRAQGRVLERLVPRVRDIRRFGSAALDLTWTAAGRFDAYYERSVKQWDIAAGALICERAGLEIHELQPYENLPWGILAAPPALAAPLLELVAGP